MNWMLFVATWALYIMYMLALSIISIFVLLVSAGIYDYTILLNLKFWGGLSLPWNAYVKFFGPLPTPTEVKIITDPNKISDISYLRTKVPLLFKGVLKKENIGDISKFNFFPKMKPNLFDPDHIAEDRPRTESAPFSRKFAQEMNDGNYEVIEKIPVIGNNILCADDQFAGFLNNDEWKSVMTAMMTSEERNEFWSKMSKLTHLPDNFIYEAESQTLALFFSKSDTSLVYYTHAHMDGFFSFSTCQSKEWHLTSPMYADCFDNVWSGLAILPLKQKSEAPVMIVKQEPGDLLYVPPWWYHKTKNPERSSFGLNVHTVGGIFGFGQRFSTPHVFYSYISNWLKKHSEYMTGLGSIRTARSVTQLLSLRGSKSLVADLLASGDSDDDTNAVVDGDEYDDEYDDTADAYFGAGRIPSISTIKRFMGAWSSYRME